MKETINDMITLKYHDANVEKYVKDGRYRINVDALRDAYFGSTEHTEYVITELVSVIGELNRELLLSFKDFDDRKKELMRYSDQIIAAYLTIVKENVEHEKYIKSQHDKQ